ncbi:hypothetical protein L0F63_005048, partial [Massospora cicadina]
LQLGEYSESLRLVEGWKLAKGASEPGQLFLEAQVFSLAGNLNEDGVVDPYHLYASA